MSIPPDSARPVVFGEVLFDVFHGDDSVLGGAPFNVAWNLQGLGVRPLLISCVGADARGKQVLDAMRGWGLDTAGVQIDADRPTGVVDVSIQDGQPEYRILENQAYDFIDASEACEVSARADTNILYHGSIGIRAAPARAALTELKRKIDCPVFLDVNLRPPWCERDIVWAGLDGATWVKLNDEELRVVCEEGSLEEHDMEAAAKKLRAQLGLEVLVVTRGDHGAFLVRKNGELLDYCQATVVEGLIDTVGAGDAFSAVMILGLIKGWPDALRLKRAIEFASFVCTLRGATTDQAPRYQEFAQRWDRQGAGRLS